MRPLPRAPLPQSRRPASLLTAAFFLTLTSLLMFPSPACAAENPVIVDHGALSQSELHMPANEQVIHAEVDDLNTEGSGSYAPDFSYLDRSLIGRQSPEINKLVNNQKVEMNIDPGSTVYFVLAKGQSNTRRSEQVPPEALAAQVTDNTSGEVNQEKDIEQETADDAGVRHELKTRQAGQRIFISATTCRQPQPNNNGTSIPPDQPQLAMYVSTSSQNQKPGPDSTANLATTSPANVFQGGYVGVQIQTDGDVYIGISAPNITKDWFGSWHFEVATSTDGFYHGYSSTSAFLEMIDTDSESALFITHDLASSNDTNSVDKFQNQNPFKMYVMPSGNGNWTPITGMEYSYCALKEQLNSTSTKNLTISTKVTTKFINKLPKSQFHVQGLDVAKTYNAFLVVEENQLTSDISDVGAVKGGGKVFRAFPWTTKADDSCQVLFDLEFCDSVAYAVPSSLKFKFDDTGLKKLYDDQASNYYQNFLKSLSQVACDTYPEAQYSLARTCKDCERAYKNWLCSVLIPRCEDFTANDTWLQPRNIDVPFPDGTFAFSNNLTKEFNTTHRQRFAFNRSRNPLIDKEIQPGPYKELKPCEDLCFDIVRSCPAQLKFACPNSPARELTYGTRDPEDKNLTCNFPGAVVKLNLQGAAGSLDARSGSVALIALIVAAFLWV